MSVLARLFILVAIAVLPALTIEAYTQLELRQEREQEVRQNALRLATFAAGELDRIVENGFGLLAALSKLPAVRERDAAACSSYFAELKQLYPQYRLIGATDASGTPFCASTEPTPGLDFDDLPHWREAIETGEFTVGAYSMGPIAAGPILPLALAFRDASGTIAGVVYVSLDLDWLARYFEEKRFDRDKTIAIADRNATLLLRLPDNENYVGTPFAETYHRYVYAAEPGTADIVGIDGVSRILGYIPIRRGAAPGLYVGIGLTRAAAFAAIDRATLTGVALLTTGLALALGAAWIGGRHFLSRPLARLAQAAGHWRQGDFRPRVEPYGGGEIALLGNAFNSMAAELADQQQENAKLLATLEQRVAERTEELAREVEERRKAEFALVQSQKMEAIGQLTGGIAHDFNNLLTSVIGNLELAETRLGGSEAHPVLRHLVDARRSAERGAALTRDLLAFARKQSLRVEPIDLNAVVRRADDLLRRSVGPPVRIERRLAPLLWPALADASQMELVILNLSINARDALPKGGTITIETENIAADDPRRPSDLPGGDYVRLAVSDTGTGMTEDVLARCLEPFFTTKDVGKGSGLGLSVVHGIAAQSGASIDIRTALGHGTTVSVYLPRADRQAAPEQPREEPAPSPERVPFPARVLLVDDDVDVREVIAEQLRELGCSVVEAASGPAALDLIDGHAPSAFDLLVSDYAMPGLSGTALARAARERCPELPVLLITGYNDLMSDTRPGEDWGWLSKPFRQADLAEQIRRIFPGKRSAAGPIA